MKEMVRHQGERRGTKEKEEKKKNEEKEENKRDGSLFS